MKQEDVDKLIAMHAHTRLMFKGPYSQTTRFVERFKGHPDKGTMAVLDNGNEIGLRPDEVTLKDFIMAMEIPS